MLKNKTILPPRVCFSVTADGLCRQGCVDRDVKIAGPKTLCLTMIIICVPVLMKLVGVPTRSCKKFSFYPVAVSKWSAHQG